MQTTLVEVPPFVIVGFHARTNNLMEMAGFGVIPKLWENVLASQDLANISHRVDAAYYSLYTDYESDEHGEYTYVAGVKVNQSPTRVPAECGVFEVRGATYARVTTPKGTRPQMLIDTWKNILLAPPASPAGRRAFIQDFEVYDDRAQDPQNSEIDIYLSFRE